MAKEAETKVEVKATTVVIEETVEEDFITEEWEEAICTVTCYRKQLQTLSEEKEMLATQKSALSKRVFDLQNEIRLLEAKILLTFEHVVKVNYGAPQMIMIAEGQLHAVD